MGSQKKEAILQEIKWTANFKMGASEDNSEVAKWVNQKSKMVRFINQSKNRQEKKAKFVKAYSGEY